DFHVTGVQTCALPILRYLTIAHCEYPQAVVGSPFVVPELFDITCSDKRHYPLLNGGLRFPLESFRQPSLSPTFQDRQTFFPYFLDRKSTRLNSSHVKI